MRFNVADCTAGYIAHTDFFFRHSERFNGQDSEDIVLLVMWLYLHTEQQQHIRMQ